jgi:hypothetical protein
MAVILLPKLGHPDENCGKIRVLARTVSSNGLKIFHVNLVDIFVLITGKKGLALRVKQSFFFIISCHSKDCCGSSKPYL